MIVERGGLDPVLGNLDAPQTSVLKGASSAVANLALEQLNHPEMLERGTVEKLVSLARKCKNDEVQYRVACALNALASNGEIKNVLKERGAADGLKVLVRSRDPETKAVAIEALAKLGIHAKSKADKERAERERLEREERERQEREALERAALEKAERERAERERLEREERERIEREAREAAARREEEERRRREEEERRLQEEEERRRAQEEAKRKRQEALERKQNVSDKKL